MLETLGGVVGAIVVGALFVFSFRRRWRMSPEQRQREDTQRDIRELKREQERQRWS